MSLEEAARVMDEEFPGWREMEPEEIRHRMLQKIDGILDLVNDLDDLHAGEPHA